MPEYALDNFILVAGMGGSKIGRRNAYPLLVASLSPEPASSGVMDAPGRESAEQSAVIHVMPAQDRVSSVHDVIRTGPLSATSANCLIDHLPADFASVLGRSGWHDGLWNHHVHVYQRT